MNIGMEFAASPKIQVVGCHKGDFSELVFQKQVFWESGCGAMGVEPQLLITDDDEAFRETLGEALQRKGFSVTLAADGAQAVELVRAQTFHLMVLDMHMPRLNGLDTILLVRQWFDSLPCILMSAKLDDQIVTTARSIPTVEVMSKPFPLKLFTDTIRDSLRRAYQWPML
jgi:DNA-binding response OmpR family regulator